MTYTERRLLDEYAVELEHLMIRNRVTMTDLSKRTKIDRTVISDILNCRVDDIDLFTMVDLIYAAGGKLRVSFKQGSAVRSAK